MQSATGAEDVSGLLYTLADQMRLQAANYRRLALPACTREQLRADPYIAFLEWLQQVERLLDGSNQLIPVRQVLMADMAQVTARPGHPGVDTPGRPAFGATARVSERKGDSRPRIAQVDGGTGHSGRRSPDLHLGLGNLAKGATVEVELKWRDTAGKPQFTILNLTPGWHTVVLGSMKPAQTAALNSRP